MSKIRYKKRIMPRDGRMVNGCYQPDYALGYEHGSNPSKWHLVPVCVRSDPGETKAMTDRVCHETHDVKRYVDDKGRHVLDLRGLTTEKTGGVRTIAYGSPASDRALMLTPRHKRGVQQRPVSGEYLAAGGAYWAGVRRGMRDHHLGNSEGEIKLGALRTKQMRALIAELQREVGEEALSKYLAKGGRVSDLVDMLNARSRSDEYRPKLTVGLRG